MKEKIHLYGVKIETASKLLYLGKPTYKNHILNVIGSDCEDVITKCRLNFPNHHTKFLEILEMEGVDIV